MVAELNPTLVRVLLQLAVVVTTMLVVATAAFVGIDRIRRTYHEWESRMRTVWPGAVLLVVALLVNSVVRQVIDQISWIIARNLNLTWVVYDVEGPFIIWLQSHATPTLTAYFSFVYIYGYVFILVFPLIAYFSLSDTRPLRETLAAYTLNYLIGLVVYALIILYGPRNIAPELAQGLLYETYPEYQNLTSQVNRNTNTFPSLHTSLSTTVALLAHRTRDEYPRWYYVATFFAASIAFSTVYLGIHWVVDVIAGIVLAYVCVQLASELVENPRFDFSVLDPRKE